MQWSSFLLFSFSREPNRGEEKCNLSGTHGGLKGREPMVEGTENGDHVVRDRLALMQRLSHEHRSFAQGLHCLWNPHFFFFLFSPDFPSLCFCLSVW